MIGILRQLSEARVRQLSDLNKPAEDESYLLDSFLYFLFYFYLLLLLLLLFYFLFIEHYFKRKKMKLQELA